MVLDGMCALQHSGEGQAVSQNAPGFSQNDDPYKLLRAHVGEAGEVTEVIIGKQGQQDGGKQGQGEIPASAQPAGPFCVAFPWKQSLYEAGAVLSGKEKGDNGTYTDSKVVVPEPAGCSEQKGSRGTSEESGKHRKDHLKCLEQGENGRSHDSKPFDVVAERFQGMEPALHICSDKQDTEDGKQSRKDDGDGLLPPFSLKLSGVTGHGLRFPERGRDMALVLVWTRFRGLSESALLSDGLIYFHA